MIFNPLEIGEMIESEDFDWEPPVGAGSAAAFTPPPAPPPITGQALPQNLDDTGGLSWLDEADRNHPSPSARADSLFDEEDDFFDLAAELEQELSQEEFFKGGDGMLVQQAEQSLEEIVEGFKKGVSEHLSPTDYDTHFNLGIAYREMGLIDEAIGEFQVAAKDPGHLVLCCSMLGLCFLDKGLPELAVKWYKRGLEAPGLSEEDNLGLLYDLGCAYLVVEDKASAYKAFVDLYGINNTYRDVVARIEELGR
jgi:tetratricopeptide (TPR) repeat protein